MSDEPFGYGEHWWDRAARGRRIGAVIAGIGIVVGTLIVILL